MDKHYLTSLFSPASIMVFAGPPDQRAQQTPLARAFLDGLRGEGRAPGKAFTGPVSHLDIHMSGTLAALAQSRADLAVIALPAKQIAAALKVAGRIRCRAARVLCSGLDAAHCAELTLPLSDVVHSHSVTRLSWTGPRAILLRTSSD